jgi:cytochrome c biogenesis protein CcdA
MVGTALSLAVVGAVAGFVGQVAGATLGRYWRFVGGLVMVLFGLSTLRLLNVRVPKIGIGQRVLGVGVAPAGGTAPTGGAAGAVIYGLAVGGATTACSACCNPVLPVAMGAVALKGAPVLGAAMLAVFALGYSLPLAAGMVGLGFGLGRLGAVARRIMPAVQVGFGLLLIGVGFYLLAKA